MRSGKWTHLVMTAAAFAVLAAPGAAFAQFPRQAQSRVEAQNRADYNRGYQQGMREGQRDGERNRPFSSNARGNGNGRRDADFRNGFAAGYRSGYDQGRSRIVQQTRRQNDGFGRRVPGAYQEPAFARGYSDGVNRGASDGRDRDRYDPVGEKDYRQADQGYYKEYGSKDAYKNNYRAGFRQGYEEGYRGAPRR